MSQSKSLRVKPINNFTLGSKILPLPIPSSITSQEETEYVDEPPAKKTKSAVGKSERTRTEQHDVYDGSLSSEKEAAGGANIQERGRETEKSGNWHT